MDAEGVFYQMPYSSDGEPLPRQSVTLFNPSSNKDKFENTALDRQRQDRRRSMRSTPGAYLVRNIEQTQDYTNYARGFYAGYYQCHGAEPAQRPGRDLLLAQLPPGTRPSATRIRATNFA